MANPVWPVGMPQGVLLEGLGSTYEASYRTFKPEVGRPIRSSTSTRTFEILQVNYFLNSTQRAIWWSFWKTDLRRGIESFDWPHPLTEAVQEVELAGDEVPQCNLIAGSHDRWILPLTLRCLDDT